MKLIILLSILLVPLFAKAQKNEFSTFLGKAIHNGDVFQLKYQRNFKNQFSIRTGYRNHYDIKYTEYSYESQTTERTEYSQIVQSSYKSKKVDFTFLISPFNKQNFNVYIGIGIDAGLTDYSFTSQSLTFSQNTAIFLDGARVWSADIATNLDLGAHFILESSYKFKSNTLIKLQLMHNEVYDNKPQSITRKYLNVISPLCISLGIGFSF